jgi:hypothetical protein
MDHLRIGSLGLGDWHTGQLKDAPRRRSRHTHSEPPEDPIDRVVLSSAGDNEEDRTEEPED